MLTFMTWECSKSAYKSYFLKFWPILGPYDPLKSPVHYQESMLISSYSPKSLLKLVLPANGVISISLKRKCSKRPKMSYFMQFQPFFGPYDPLKSPLLYQRSTLTGSYNPKILHKLVLPENGFISFFFEVKIFQK